MKGSHSFGRPWLLLCAAFAAHIVDEAANDFLALYNPIVIEIRRRIVWIPLPTFTYSTWLALLLCALALLLALSLYAYRDSRRLRPLAYFFAIVMLANGLLHIVGSLYLGRLAAGVYSSPLLIAASLYLLVALRGCA